MAQAITCIREEVFKFVQLNEQLFKHKFWEQNQLQASIAMDHLHKVVQELYIYDHSTS